MKDMYLLHTGDVLILQVVRESLLHNNNLKYVTRNCNRIYQSLCVLSQQRTRCLWSLLKLPRRRRCIHRMELRCHGLTLVPMRQLVRQFVVAGQGGCVSL
jgi:hypothetical protein